MKQNKSKQQNDCLPALSQAGHIWSNLAPSPSKMFTYLSDHLITGTANQNTPYTETAVYKSDRFQLLKRG